MREELNLQFIRVSPEGRAEFVKTVPAEYLFLTSPEIEYRSFLRDLYRGSLADLNRAHGARYESFHVVPIPVRETDYRDFLANKGALRREFLTANYKQVLDYILLHGRSLRNTAVYCILAMFLALTINPMAAYALSRFKLPSTYKVPVPAPAERAHGPHVRGAAGGRRPHVRRVRLLPEHHHPGNRRAGRKIASAARQFDYIPQMSPGKRKKKQS